MSPLLLLAFLVQIALGDPVPTDFRRISYNDLAEKQIFQRDNVTTFSQLLFDVARMQVVVGARDNLYRLTLTSLTPLEHAKWPAAKEKIGTCQDKGQTVEDCHNYIKVLLSNGKSIFTCGTNAFSPQCSWREIENISRVSTWINGVAMCPYSPHSNVTALLARGQFGGLFAGTPTDFSGNDAAIYRNLASQNLRTRQYDSKWLNDPQFVGSFETEQYVYFLFRESAVEYINCGKKIYSRIARVCKYDPGSPILMKDTWTTFSKARLNCSLPGEFPFYYDEIQGAAYQPEENLVYATFTTPSNGIAGSAICAFNMSAIESAFNGPFKHQEHTGAAWERMSVSSSHQSCGPSTFKSASRQLTNNQKYQLMDKAVQPITLSPLHTSEHERFTHVAVDLTPTKVHRNMAVLYVATNEGLIKKISVLPRTLETCIIEVWGPLPSATITLQYLKETKSLYVGMQNALLRIPTVQCYRHRDAKACINAQEPYCGWDEHLLKCVPAPSQNPKGYLVEHWQQDATKCPVLNDPVNGGWGSWKEWNKCYHSNSGSPKVSSSGHRHSSFSKSSTDDESNSDTCMCQIRECNNPLPQNGGQGCTGPHIKVTNCTVHGGWTSWSPWSACSKSCGNASKIRKRSCTNPAPAHGGRTCVGPDQEEDLCLELPACPSVYETGAITAKGIWTSWGPWSACSRLCNGGIRVRRRTCEHPTRKDANVECPGCNIQVEECNIQPCHEPTKKYFWSPWFVTNVTEQELVGGHSEKRYKFVCRAQTEDPSSVKFQPVKEEERFCRNDGLCNKKSLPSAVSLEVDGSWENWSNWSPCSHSCGGGSQYRTKPCESPSCEGTVHETRSCNQHPCKNDKNVQVVVEGQWGCWTDWTECSVSCGFGHKTKSRHCLGPGTCDGPSKIKEACEMPSCELFKGWGAWSQWTKCEEGVQYRKRKCMVKPSLADLDCIGPREQVRRCFDELEDNDINALPSKVEMAGVTVGAVVGSCIAGFLLGLALTAVVCFFYLKNQKPRYPGSPCYVTSKQNPYVTVPLKEVTSSRKTNSNNRLNYSSLDKRLYKRQNQTNSLIITRDPNKKQVDKPRIFSFPALHHSASQQQINNHHPKRQPSFSGSINGTLRSNGTLRGKNNTVVNGLASPKLYPKSIESSYESGTLKRNSGHQITEQEKYY